jgi:hypothetical protein
MLGVKGDGEAESVFGHDASQDVDVAVAAGSPLTHGKAPQPPAGHAASVQRSPRTVTFVPPKIGFPASGMFHMELTGDSYNGLGVLGADGSFGALLSAPHTGHAAPRKKGSKSKPAAPPLPPREKQTQTEAPQVDAPWLLGSMLYNAKPTRDRDVSPPRNPPALIAADLAHWCDTAGRAVEIDERDDVLQLLLQRPVKPMDDSRAPTTIKPMKSAIPNKYASPGADVAGFRFGVRCAVPVPMWPVFRYHIFRPPQPADGRSGQARLASVKSIAQQHGLLFPSPVSRATRRPRR